jgi:hypothetical protein
VRWLAFLSLAFSSTTVWAQDQERSLIDRLLRPNMDLQNRAQGKAFTANTKVVAAHGNTATLVLEPTAKEKTFGDTRAAVTKEYRPGSVQTDSQRRFLVQTRNAHAPTQLAVSSAGGLHAAYDAKLEVSGRSFADDRPFREEGKSQKSLDRQNPPLTIDQVRELLNKNK